MAAKLSDPERDEIRRLKAKGATRDQIARKLGRSAGAVSKVLAATAATRKRNDGPAVTTTRAASAEEFTLENLASDIATQMGDLVGDARRARRAGDDVALARAQRHLASLLPVAARVAKSRPAADGMVLVSAVEMREAGDRCAKRLRDMLERTIAKHKPGAA